MAQACSNSTCRIHLLGSAAPLRQRLFPMAPPPLLRSVTDACKVFDKTSAPRAAAERLVDRRTQQQALTPMAPATSSHGVAPSQGELLLILTLCSLSNFADHQLKLQLRLTFLPLLQQRQMFDKTPRRPCSEEPLFFTLCAAS
ncbi:hypothetical protein U9M48_043423 [Paspalum notatum var. saurae]|uniref:Uncharacterized protein n=1 Tax=Paspalum notatum var. saurae TaxID=547442 RepID=A0AAQ3UT45_PASNO